jgi:glycosyltransferase involved in cell wall biosynthesis
MARTQPRIAVITPYYNEPDEYFSTCYSSVKSQQIPADHFFIADGHPSRWFDDKEVKHVALHRCHYDNGNTPRGIGSLLAIGDGYEFIALLDVDNWYHPEHLETMLELHERSDAPICCAWRTFHTYDGAPLKVSERDENNLSHVDTSCFFIHRSAFDILRLWLAMPKEVSPIGDRIFLASIKDRRLKVAHTLKRTVAFRSQYAIHYRVAGINPTMLLKPDTVLDSSFAYLQSDRGRSHMEAILGFAPFAAIKSPQLVGG